MTAADIFFTPPLAPLNLDLAALSGGGGWAPAEFEGQLHDGRNMYARYRGGQLSIYISKEIEEEAYLEENCVLTAHLGPPFHGGLSLGQFCRYAGCTIRGSLPPMPGETEIQENVLLDLSGHTTFMDFWAESTAASALNLYDQILVRLTDVVGAQKDGQGYRICRSASEASSRYLEFFRAEAQYRPDGDWPAHLVNVGSFGAGVGFGLISHAAFRPPFRPRGVSINERLLASVRRPLAFLGSDDFPVDHLHLRVSFPTSDHKSRMLAAAVHEIASAIYPLEPVEGVDLVSSMPRPELRGQRRLERAATRWLRDGPDRWITAYQDPDSSPPKFIGWRLRT